MIASFLWFEMNGASGDQYGERAKNLIECQEEDRAHRFFALAADAVDVVIWQ